MNMHKKEFMIENILSELKNSDILQEMLFMYHVEMLFMYLY